MVSIRVFTALLLIVMDGVNVRLVADEPATNDKSQYVLPWGPNPWPDAIAVPRPPKEPPEGTYLGWTPGKMPNLANCRRSKYVDGFSGTIEDKSGLLMKQPFSFSFSAGNLVHGVRFAVCGQVYQYRDGDRCVVYRKNHPRNVPPKDAVGIFTMNHRLTVAGVEFQRYTEYKVEFDPMSRVDRFPATCITVYGTGNEILSPKPDNGKTHSITFSDNTTRFGQISTLKVDDIIETTYFKFKVHSIVMPDEKEQINGWINIKLIESKPVTK